VLPNTAAQRVFDDENNVAILLYFSVFQELIGKEAVTASPNDPAIVPLTLDDNDLDNYKQRLQVFFSIADKNKNGNLSFEEFKLLLNHLNLKTLNDLQMREIYRDMNDRKDDKLLPEDIFKYLRSIIIMEDNFSPAKLCLFEAMLTADHLNQCVLGGITQFLNKTWSKFGQYKRYGQSGQLVMSSGDNIAVITEGNYSLVDLICWPDQLTENIEPKHVVIKGVRTCLDYFTSRPRKSVTSKKLIRSFFFYFRILSSKLSSGKI
jgi:hypothetical protein